MPSNPNRIAATEDLPGAELRYQDLDEEIWLVRVWDSSTTRNVVLTPRTIFFADDTENAQDRTDKFRDPVQAARVWAWQNW